MFYLKSLGEVHCTAVRCVYTNYKAVRAVRNIIPKSLEYKSTFYHSEKQWILKVYDLDKKAEREYALKDMDFTCGEYSFDTPSSTTLNFYRDEKVLK